MNAEAEHLTDEEIAELVEGKLVGSRLVSAERHLSACASCRHLLAGLDSSGITSHMQGVSRDLPAARLLARGARLGRYEIVELVGEGAMGRVYAARDPLLDRRVALKLLHPHVASAENRVRLLREAKALARLSHPNLITVYDAGDSDEQVFIAMEFIDGQTLRAWLAQAPRSWRAVLQAFGHAGRGLLHAHEAGIVHRDFKPDNVLVSKDGQIRVTDFGLAHAVHLHTTEHELATLGHAATLDGVETRSGALLGTPRYMSPEQYESTRVDARSDIYSFCLALYEALYGVVPYASHAHKLLGELQAPGREHDVPNRLRKVILLGLRRNPQERYASMRALLDALEVAASPPRLWTNAVPGVVLAAALLALGVRGLHACGETTTRSAATAAHIPCTSNRACVESHGGEPYVCRKTCVALKTSNCEPLFEPGDLLREDTVWIGALFPRLQRSEGGMNAHAVALARSEIAQQMAPFVAATGPLHRPAIAVVSCDDSVSPVHTAKLLVENVRVPALVGFGNGNEVVDVARTISLPHDVLNMSTLSSNALITKLPKLAGVPRMVWTTVPSSEATAEASAAFIRNGLPRARGPVVLARYTSSGPLPFAQRLFARLAASSGAASDRLAYREVTFSWEPSTDELTRLAAEIVAGSPGVIVLLGADTVTTPLVRMIEHTAGKLKPIYLLADAGTVSLSHFIGKNAELRRRVFGTVPAAIPNREQHFVLRFNLSYPHEASLAINPATTYDGFYLLAYAIYAAGPGASGSALAEALTHFRPPGRVIDTGPDDFLTAIDLLAHGEAIDPQGPSGALDFDPQTGAITRDYALLCAAIDESGRAVGDLESGVVFHAAERSVHGQMHCP